MQPYDFGTAWELVEPDMSKNMYMYTYVWRDEMTSSLDRLIVSSVSKRQQQHFTSHILSHEINFILCVKKCEKSELERASERGWLATSS